MDNAKLLRTGVIGSIIVALCCFTPVLVILLGTVGLSALTGYLDCVLFPALIMFLGIAGSPLFVNSHHNKIRPVVILAIKMAGKTMNNDNGQSGDRRCSLWKC